MTSLTRRVLVLMDSIEDDYQAAIVRGMTRAAAAAKVQLVCAAGGVLGHDRGDPRAQRNFLLPASTSLEKVVSAIKARWSCEQMHQQMKRNLASITSRADLGTAYTTTSCSA